MTENKMNTASNKMVAVILDVLGLILVLVGALINYVHRSAGGVALFWVGFILLIVALLLFLWDAMQKPMMQKM